jgi:hypothetical protein
MLLLMLLLLLFEEERPSKRFLNDLKAFLLLAPLLPEPEGWLMGCTTGEPILSTEKDGLRVPDTLCLAGESARDIVAVHVPSLVLAE